MSLQSYSANITNKRIRRNFSYQNIIMFNMSIKYPEISMADNTRVAQRINRDIQSQINAFLAYAATDFYNQAVREYRKAIENNYPFRTFEAVLNYTVTYNRNCHFSLYRDQYEYTGGAHGSTIRYSDTWNLQTGRTVPLRSFFRQDINYVDFLTKYMIRQAKEQIEQGNNKYFDNYQELIIKNFKPKNFYLTQTGIAIYYQQYEIAPYATGIVDFIIPYSKVHNSPSCTKF